MKTVAIIGRPNVGKSTFFNRIARKNSAIVHDTAGVTRDRKYEIVDFYGLKFRLVDTAGLEESAPNTLQNKMLKQTDFAADEADVLIFVVDATTGLTAEDKHFAKWLRKKDKPILLVANKAEGNNTKLQEFLRLGFGEPIAISAEHKLGIDDFYQEFRKFVEDDSQPENEKEQRIQLAIIGRPNAGKSTIVNKIMGQERVITSPISGTTRDSINIDWEFGGEKLRLVDTAGMRRKANITENLEKISVADSLKAIKFAHVVLLVMDASTAMEKQDLRIADMVIREGRGMVVVVNKWDLVEDKRTYLAELNKLLAKNLSQVPDIPVCVISALNDDNIDEVLHKALEVYNLWNTRLPTSALNKWLEALLSNNAPPISHGRRLKIRYITQTKSRPPTFMLSVSQPENMPESYLRYLTNYLRESFNLPAVPIRILMPKKSNPFKKGEQ